MTIIAKVGVSYVDHTVTRLKSTAFPADITRLSCPPVFEERAWGWGYASDKCLAWPLLHSNNSTASSQWIFAHACVASLARRIAALSACVVTYMWLWFEAKLLLAQGFPMVMQHLFSISVICEQPVIVCRCVNQWSSCHVLQLESSLLQVSFTRTLYSGSSP